MAKAKKMLKIKPCHCGEDGAVLGERGRWYCRCADDPWCWTGLVRETRRAAILAWNAAPRKRADES